MNFPTNYPISLVTASSSVSWSICIASVGLCVSLQVHGQLLWLGYLEARSLTLEYDRCPKRHKNRVPSSILEFHNKRLQDRHTTHSLSHHHPKVTPETPHLLHQVEVKERGRDLGLAPECGHYHVPKHDKTWTPKLRSHHRNQGTIVHRHLIVRNRRPHLPTKGREGGHDHGSMPQCGHFLQKRILNLHQPQAHHGRADHPPVYCRLGYVPENSIRHHYIRQTNSPYRHLLTMNLIS